MPSITRSITVKLIATAVALVLGGAVWSAGTWSAFNRTSSNPGNSVLTGTVDLSDNDGGSALLSMAGMTNGSSTSSCVNVSYSGTATANVRLYGTVAGTGLASYLTLTITRGTFSGTPSAKSCTGFTADATNYLGSGAGVIYSGNLSAFPTTSSGAVVDPKSGSAAAWNSGDAHGYKLTVTMNSASGSGKTATADFTWLADSI